MSIAHRLAGSHVVARCTTLRAVRASAIADGIDRPPEPDAPSLFDDLRLFASNFAAGFVFLTVYLA